MLKTELLQGGKLIRTYSDTPGMGLLQTDTGVEYSEAVDVYPCPHTYEEIPMETPEREGPDEIMRQKAEAYDILMGGA